MSTSMHSMPSSFMEVMLHSGTAGKPWELRWATKELRCGGLPVVRASWMADQMRARVAGGMARCSLLAWRRRVIARTSSARRNSGVSAFEKSSGGVEDSSNHSCTSSRGFLGGRWAVVLPTSSVVVGTSSFGSILPALRTPPNTFDNSFNGIRASSRSSSFFSCKSSCVVRPV
ncbi:hypothetical protein BD413DRAFT_155104 [Trametes elegans]|nr:hypothetical protein BD413DRAFT_155104 [Trametes elegans]